jgi:hypothetical protein
MGDDRDASEPNSLMMHAARPSNAQPARMPRWPKDLPLWIAFKPAKNKVPYGWVKNHDGKFVKANLESVTAAAAGVAQAMSDDFRVSITDAPGAKAYPISSFTWLLVPAEFSDKANSKP